jgi:hypothetical protein
MLSQKPLLRMLSMVSEPIASSVGVGAIVGGNVDMSATGPISPSNWNSFNVKVDLSPNPKGIVALNCGISGVAGAAPEPRDTGFDSGAGVSRRADISARRNLLYSAGVCSGFAEMFSRTSATSLTSPIVCSSCSRNAWNSGRISCGAIC